MGLFRICLAATAAHVLCCNPPSTQRTDPPPDDDSKRLLTGGLLSSPDEAHLKKELVLAAELARTIEQLSGVTEARVHLSLESTSLLMRDKKAESRAAVLITTRTPNTPTQMEIKKLASAAVHGLEPDDVSVFYTTAASEKVETVKVGPIEVTKASAFSAKLIIGGLLLACLVSALGLVVAGFKLRASKKRVNRDG